MIFTIDQNPDTDDEDEIQRLKNIKGIKISEYPR